MSGDIKRGMGLKMPFLSFFALQFGGIFYRIAGFFMPSQSDWTETTTRLPSLTARICPVLTKFAMSSWQRPTESGILTMAQNAPSSKTMITRTERQSPPIRQTFYRPCLSMVCVFCSILSVHRVPQLQPVHRESFRYHQSRYSTWAARCPQIMKGLSQLSELGKNI